MTSYLNIRVTFNVCTCEIKIIRKMAVERLLALYYCLSKLVYSVELVVTESTVVYYV